MKDHMLSCAFMTGFCSPVFLAPGITARVTGCMRAVHRCQVSAAAEEIQPVLFAESTPTPAISSAPFTLAPPCSCESKSCNFLLQNICGCFLGWSEIAHPYCFLTSERPPPRALIMESPFYYVQNEDILNQGGETEQGSEDDGSACARGPRGPAGPPGIEVGSKIFSCSTAHLPHTACNVSAARPFWFLSAAHLF